MTLDEFQQELLKVVTEAKDASTLHEKMFNADTGLVHKSTTVDAKGQGKVRALIEIATKRLNDLTDEFKDRSITDWKRARAVIEHENALTNYRLTWMIQTQTILFAAFGLLLNLYGSKPSQLPSESSKESVQIRQSGEPQPQSSVAPPTPPVQRIFLGLIVIVAATGIAFCLAIWRLLLGAEFHHEHIREWWQARYVTGKTPQPPPYPDVDGDLCHPSVAGKQRWWIDRRATASNLPWILIIAWSTLCILSAWLLFQHRSDDFLYSLSVLALILILFLIVLLFRALLRGIRQRAYAAGLRDGSKRAVSPLPGS